MDAQKLASRAGKINGGRQNAITIKIQGVVCTRAYASPTREFKHQHTKHRAGEPANQRTGERMNQRTIGSTEHVGTCRNMLYMWRIPFRYGETQ